ncbi:MAG: hypothetical protein QOJ79_729 [Actinomycetota bacterium]|jgi:hypothetical protein|nr:hypothetical protein [Actinomycetota bacterium]
MKTRALLLSASLVLVGYAGIATAASKAKPVCNLVQDAKGDAGINGQAGADGDDIVSADIASDATTVTAVVRVAGLQVPDPQSPLGRSYSVLFTAPGSADLLYLAARTYPQGTKFIFGYQAVDPNTGVNTNYSLGDATGTVDTAKGEVHVSAPIKAFVDGAKAKLARGAKLAGLSASVDRIYGQGVVPSQSPVPGGPRVPLGGFTLQFDDAAGGSYLMGTPSCVIVGK